MLSVYGDESADETKQRAFAVAGVVGREESWEEIETAWISRTSGIPFHANDCDSDFGDHRSSPHRENKALYRDLSLILASSALGGWGFVIDLAAQRRIFPQAPDIAYYKAFLEVLQAMTNFAINNREEIRFTFDSRRESDHNAGELYRMFTLYAEHGVGLPPQVCFSSARDNPRLQIADLFTREALKAYDNRFGPKRREPRKSWMALRDTQRFHIDAIGEDWFKSLKQQLPKIEETLSVSSGGYAQWLEHHRLPHSISNLHRYHEDSSRRKVTPPADSSRQ